MKKSTMFKVSMLATAIMMSASFSAVAGSYTVKAGDTLFEIAQAHGVSLDALVKANPMISNPDVIEKGITLSIPGGGDMAAYEKAVAEANAALDKAASVKGEWRDSRWKKSTFVKYTTPDGKTVKSSFMGAAEEAAKHGDYASALKFLETAKFQGEMGYEQAMGQKNAGPRL